MTVTVTDLEAATTAWLRATRQHRTASRGLAPMVRGELRRASRGAEAAAERERRQRSLFERDADADVERAF